MLWCPRLDHFARFNADGTISRCGHMVESPRFDSLSEMESSTWLHNVKTQMAQNTWPRECERCHETERVNNQSIRIHALNVHDQRSRDDYLQIGGVLDNVCNSACQFCSAQHSTKIAALQGQTLTVDNYAKFLQLPLDRIEHLDINGGEPSNSKNYRHLINNLPRNLRTLRVNTNGSRVIEELEKINKSGISVTVTMSFDGIDAVHDYVRWPIQWTGFYQNLMRYRRFDLHDLNLWTTVNVLNVGDLPNILRFVDQHNLHHSFALLHTPEVLSIKYSNNLTRRAKELLKQSGYTELNSLADLVATERDNSDELRTFIDRQDRLRKITISDYIDVKI